MGDRAEGPGWPSKSKVLELYSLHRPCVCCSHHKSSFLLFPLQPFVFLSIPLFCIPRLGSINYAKSVSKYAKYPIHIVSALVCLANYLHRRKLELVQLYAIDVLGIVLHLYGVFGPNLLPKPLLANSSRKEKGGKYLGGL